ncbi:hypothetical protein L0Y69_00855 [bacterium]|nr:hypothetical protein [bacterium]
METENNDTSNEEILEKIERIEAVEEDNNRMLKKLYSAMQWSRAVKAIYLLVILSVMFGLYYYIQPYIGDFVEAYKGAQGMIGSFKNF